MSGDHAHSGPAAAPGNAAGRSRRLWLTLVLNLGIVVAQVAIGIVAHSLGLLADAGHNLTDVLAIVTSLVAVRFAARTAPDRRSYGNHRATILAAVFNAASILAITVLITYEGVRRIVDPPDVRGGLIVVVAFGAAVLNGLSMLILRESGDDHGHAHGGDLNMRSVMLHMLGDTLASVGVGVAGLVILMTGRYQWLDPAASIAIGLLIAIEAVRLLRQAVDVLLESTPADIDLESLSAAVTGVDTVESVHDLHVWSISSELRALSAHVLLAGDPSLIDAQLVGDNLKTMLAERFHISHVTLELESEACDARHAACAVYNPTQPEPTAP